MNQKLLLALFLIFKLTYSQNTVGIILNTEDSYNAYTLFTAEKITYLINNCGEVINSWTSNYPPGNAVYLLEDGSLLRACSVNNPNITLGGSGGRIEKYSWDGDLIWSYNYSNETMVQHHDIYPMPNGNILVLAAKEMTNVEAIAAGRDPALLIDSTLYDEQIVELQPLGTDDAIIVWEWHISDHLIQDFDGKKLNFGTISSNPQRLNINFLNGGSKGKNWLHVNSMQYDENLDQIVISSRNLSELWIIDHSTTTLAAASSSGGNYGKGGDFLYRWGNPQAYDQGTEADRKLYGQHYPHFIKKGLKNEGKLMIFNNGDGRSPGFSEVYIITPPSSSPGTYIQATNTPFGPLTPDYIYSDLSNTPSQFFSRIVSSAQQLPNNNILICEGLKGRFFEIDENNHIVWEYISPVNSNTGAILDQGSTTSSNLVFRALKYDLNYPAFAGRDLTPKAPIEGNPDLSKCDILNIADDSFATMKIHPNPTDSYITITSSTHVDKIEVFDVLGSKIKTITNSKVIDFSTYKSGLYLIKIYSENSAITRKIIRQ